MLYHSLVFCCCSALASASGGHKIQPEAERIKVNGEFGVREFPSSVKKLSCVEYQCTSSSFLLSAFYFLSLPLQQSPVTPLAISFSSLSTLPLLFSLAHPCLSPVILFIPYFLPSIVVSPLFKFTLHKFPLVRTLPCPPSVGLLWWQVRWRIDRAQCQLLLSSLKHHTHLAGCPLMNTTPAWRRAHNK